MTKHIEPEDDFPCCRTPVEREVDERADRVLGSGTAERAREALRQSAANPWDEHRDGHPVVSGPEYRELLRKQGLSDREISARLRGARRSR